MKDYLLDQLRNNSKEFLSEVYRYPNKYKEILEKYAASYSSNELEEEEYKNAYDLEMAIRHHLTIYKIYRNVATKRYAYEKYHGYHTKKNNKEEGITKADIKISEKLVEDHYNRMDTVSQRTKEYNERYEEFIEPDEYGQMNGYTGGKVL